MKRIAYWQLLGTILLLIISEILTPILGEIRNRTYSCTYDLLFLIIIYFLGGVLISLSGIKGKIKFNLNYLNLCIFFILSFVLAMSLFFMYFLFNSFIILELLSLLVGFFFLKIFIQNNDSLKIDNKGN